MAFLACRFVRPVWLIVTLLSISHIALPATSDEYALKALYIYNFARFTDWPASSFTAADADLDFCILGEDPFGVTINQIKGRSIDGHTLNIKRFPRVAVVSACHILFISRSEEPRLDLILEAVSRRPILTISDIDRFSERGGMVTLLTQNQRIRFAINPAVAAQSNIWLSSKLLELANTIVGED